MWAKNQCRLDWSGTDHSYRMGVDLGLPFHVYFNRVPSTSYRFILLKEKKKDTHKMPNPVQELSSLI